MMGSAGPSACPVCTGAVTDVLGSLAGRPLRRCSTCGHRFLEVETAASVEAIYDDHYAGFREDLVFRREASRLLADELTRRVPPPARVLDVGCGNGEFLLVARDAGYQVVGVDVSAAAGALCRQRGIEAHVGDFRSPEVIGDEPRFQLITFWDVVEHLPDPASFLARARALLSPGGYVLIKTPLTSAASTRVSTLVPRLAGALLQAPSHIQYFDAEGLVAMLTRIGFRAVERLPRRGMRAPATGGRWRRRLARRALREFQRVVGDGNLLVLAQV